MNTRLVHGFAAAVAALALGAGASPAASAARAGEGSVTVYCSLDRNFSEPILQQFEKDTGVKVNALYDGESTKSVGFTNRIKAERERPRADVFWNNEPVNTLRLKQEGLLAEFRPKAAAKFPEAFVDPDGQWTGFAARGRVLIVNTDLVKPEDVPASLEDLVVKGRAHPEWKGKIAIARPQFGMTASWVTALLVEDDERRLRSDIAPTAMANADALKALMTDLNARILLGNKTTAEAVGRGDFAMGFTDTDDAVIEKEVAKNPVAMVAIRSVGGRAMYLPNTLALVKGAPNRANGERLIEYLLAPAVERALAASQSAQIPVNPDAAPADGALARTPTPATDPALVVDWIKVAAKWDAAMKWATENIGE